MDTLTGTADELLDDHEAGALLRYKPQTLRKMRLKHTGPPFVKYPGRRGRVLYRRSSLLAWIQAHEVATADRA